MSYIGNLPTSVAFLTDSFSGNGSTTAFTMSAAPANTASILVAVSGVLQDPSTYSVSGLTLTFSAAPPSGTGNISVRYLGIPASGVTTTAYRTVTEFTATASQTTFTPPSYTVGYIDVLRNGVRLGSADYTATNGTTVVLASGATAGDLITIVSFYVSSVLNAIPATAGSVNDTYLGTGAVIQTKIATGVAGTGPAFSAYSSSGTTLSSGTWTKLTFDTEEFDTNNNFASNRFTPTVAGYYQISANADVDAGVGITTQTRSVIGIYKNGSLYKCGGVAWSLGSGTRELSDTISALVYCNGSTDYIEIYQNVTTGSGTPNAGGGQAFTWVTGAMVRAA